MKNLPIISLEESGWALGQVSNFLYTKWILLPYCRTTRYNGKMQSIFLLGRNSGWGVLVLLLCLGWRGPCYHDSKPLFPPLLPTSALRSSKTQESPLGLSDCCYRETGCVTKQHYIAAQIGTWMPCGTAPPGDSVHITSSLTCFGNMFEKQGRLYTNWSNR